MFSIFVEIYHVQNELNVAYLAGKSKFLNFLSEIVFDGRNLKMVGLKAMV